MSRKRNRGTVPRRARSVFHSRGCGRVRSPAAAFSNDGMDSAQDPLQLARAAVRTSYLDLLLRVPQEQLDQPLALLTGEFVNGQTISSLKTRAIECGHTCTIL